MSSDPYRTLGLSHTASPDEIHRAYRALAMRFHPDRNTAAGAADVMAEINRAYELLQDPARRREFGSRCDSGIARAILDAARDVILRQRPEIVAEDARHLLLRVSGDRVWTAFLEPDEFPDLAAIRRSSAALHVWLSTLPFSGTATILDRPIPTVHIDVVHGIRTGVSMPNAAVAGLFGPLVRDIIRPS